MLLLILWTETLIGGLLNLEGILNKNANSCHWRRQKSSENTGFYSTIRIL